MRRVIGGTLRRGGGAAAAPAAAAAAAAVAVRRLGEQSTVLGTDAFDSKFVGMLRNELRVDETDSGGPDRFGRSTFSSCIRKGELDHMESPAADDAHIAKTDKQIESLFARLPPPPGDPMTAALAKTDAELKENEGMEMLREAMRQKYHSMKRRNSQEADRIEQAMAQIQLGAHRSQRPKWVKPGEDDDSGIVADPAVVAAVAAHNAAPAKAAKRAAAARAARAAEDDELAALRARIQALEAELAARTGGGAAATPTPE